jgi:hypothetical protein
MEEEVVAVVQNRAEKRMAGNSPLVPAKLTTNKKLGKRRIGIWCTWAPVLPPLSDF